MKTSLVAAGAALASALVTLPAHAGSNLDDLRTQALIEKLLRGTNSAHKAMTETVHGRVKVTGKIHRKGSFSLPMYCTVNFRYYDGDNSFGEFKSVPAEFHNKTGTCTVFLAYKWKVASTAEMIEIYGEVSNNPMMGGAVAKKASSEIGRATELSFDPFPLPPNGALTELNFDVVM